MAFFDDLGKTLSTKGKEAAKKAKEITESIQLKSQISAEKNAIQDVYTQIGKRYYEEQQSIIVPEFIELFEKVRVSKEKVAQLEREVNLIEGIRTCEHCGARVADESSFCNSCGRKLEPIVKEEETEAEETETETTEEVVSDESVEEEKEGL